MAPPLVTVYVTSLTSAPTVRKHHDLLRRSLKAMEIKHEEYDLVMDEDAKRRWQRAKPPGRVIGLPGYLVGGEWIGTMDDFEEAVETQTLEQFLKQDLDIPEESAPATSAQSQDTSSASGTKQKSIQDVELEKLMKSMTDADLDELASELAVDKGVGKESPAKVGNDVSPKTQDEEVEEVTIPKVPVSISEEVALNLLNNAYPNKSPTLPDSQEEATTKDVVTPAAVEADHELDQPKESVNDAKVDEKVELKDLKMEIEIEDKEEKELASALEKIGS